MLTVSLHEPLHALPWPPASSPRNICGLRLVQAARGAMVTMSSVARAAAMRSSTGMRDRSADALEQEGQVVDHEVADPDGERRAVGEQCLLRGTPPGFSNSKERAWWRVSRSIWSTPSLRALFSKPCRVSACP